jgi:carbamoyl-phosphate synthase large subunit
MKLETRLKDIGIHTFLPTIEQFEERHKFNLSDFGHRYNLNVPDAVSIHSPSEIHKLGSDYSYPIVVKGKFYDAGIAYDAEQAKTYFHKIAAKWGLPIIIQKYVQGTEFNVTGLGDGKGNTIAAVSMRKQYITDKGKAWGGITVDDKRMLELTDKFISQTHWRGAFELELIKAQDNEFYILEINPRIPAWIYLAVGVGQNIPEALVNLALGNKVKPFDGFEVGKMFVRYSYDMIVDRSDFEQISMFGEL